MDAIREFSLRSFPIVRCGAIMAGMLEGPTCFSPCCEHQVLAHDILACPVIATQSPASLRQQPSRPLPFFWLLGATLDVRHEHPLGTNPIAELPTSQLLRRDRHRTPDMGMDVNQVAGWACAREFNKNQHAKRGRILSFIFLLHSEPL